ncbi:hypothetical protein TNCV_3693171 [Trichonephila clavipes]|nr:hypothetical protein TNCV_3693171 [Trichonephila clavipes]
MCKDGDCKNGGTCGKSGMCECLKGTSGKYCEHIEDCNTLKCADAEADCVFDTEKKKGFCACREENQWYVDGKCVKEVSVGITFQDGNRFNSCQVIYSQFGLAIHQNDHQARRRFVEWVQNEIAVVPDFHKRILFSDEAHFWLNGYVNKQNCRIWSEANPQVYVETPLHPERLTVWCTLSAGGILLQKR